LTRFASEPFIRFVSRLLVAAYLVEAGLLLVMAPWTALWDRNFFAEAVPALGDLMANQFVRGGVTGVGVVTAVAGLRDLTNAVLARLPKETPTPGPDHPPS
jgi:hypothetical protein